MYVYLFLIYRYVSGMFGKYLNVCPKQAPPGWTSWFANGGGSYENTSFSVQNIEGLPDAKNHKFDDANAIGSVAALFR